MQDEKEIWDVRRLMNWTVDYFQRKNLDSPRLCAEMILAHSLSCDRIGLYTKFAYIPVKEELDRYRSDVRRVGDGFPAAYVVGKKEFYSLSFTVTPDVLIPRPETELLVDAAVDYIRARSTPVLAMDAFTGSGCVAAAIAANDPSVVMLATDLSPAAVKVASGNMVSLGLDDRVTVLPSSLLEIPAAWNGGKRFDLLTANPPYVGDDDNVGSGVEFEPPEALFAGPDGLNIIRQVIAAAADILNSGALFCMEFGMSQADSVRDLIMATGHFEEADIRIDHQGLERLVQAVRR